MIIPSLNRYITMSDQSKKESGISIINFVFNVLCLNIYIDSSARKAPPTNEKKISVRSLIRFLLLIALCLSSANSTTVIIFTLTKYMINSLNTL